MREYGIGQSEFLWYLRGIDKISKVFSMMWNDDDLITSFDGCGLFRPPELSLLQNNINNGLNSFTFIYFHYYYNISSKKINSKYL